MIIQYGNLVDDLVIVYSILSISYSTEDSARQLSVLKRTTQTLEIEGRVSEIAHISLSAIYKYETPFGFTLPSLVIPAGGAPNSSGENASKSG